MIQHLKSNKNRTAYRPGIFRSLSCTFPVSYASCPQIDREYLDPAQNILSIRCCLQPNTGHHATGNDEAGPSDTEVVFSEDWTFGASR